MNSMAAQTKYKNMNKKTTKKQDAPIKINAVQYRGVRSLFAIRKQRREALKGRKVPLLNIVYTTAFLQFVIVICITTLITLRQDTEFFFFHTTQNFNGIFKLDDDVYSLQDSSFLRTENLINSLQNKFKIFFKLTREYSDHYIYPENILVENTTANKHHHHNLIPSAMLTFHFENPDFAPSVSYLINPMNLSILTYNTSDDLIKLVTNCHSIQSSFSIESYSFINDVRNLWRWHIDYEIKLQTTQMNMLSYIAVSYDRMDDSVSWWDKDSVAFMGSVVASFGLCAFSIMALTRFTYKYGFFFFINLAILKQLQFRIILPISHLISLLCGFIYLVNLSNIGDFNDKSELRLLIALCAWLSWCMMVFSISRQGTEYGALFQTLKMSFKPIVILLVSLFPIMIGFILFGALIFGVPDGRQMFTTPECTAKTLYAVWLGDEVLDAYKAVGIGNVIAEIYMYSWGILFIAIMYNVGLVIVEANFFMAVPQLELPEDKPGASFRDLQRIKAAKERKAKMELEAKMAKKTKHLADTDNESSDSDSDEEVDDGAMQEWELNEPEPQQNEICIFENIHSSFEFMAQTQNNKQAAIPLTTVMPKINQNSNIDDDMEDVIETKLNENEMKERNEKYMNSFVSHLKCQIINKISKGLIDKNIGTLLKQNKLSLQSQKDLDLLKDDILKKYQVYLINVKNQMTQFMGSIND